MLTKEHVKFLNNVCSSRTHPTCWTETNNIIIVRGTVNINKLNLTQIPVQFNKVTGHVSFRNNYLTNLHNSPTYVGKSYDAAYNKLTSLENGPVEVGDYYTCSNNKLKNLIGAPEICNDNFYCGSNLLTSLEGCPRIINRSLDCCNNPYLHILYGIGNVKYTIEYDHENELNEWIISRARKNIFVSYNDIAKWIKRNNKLEYLLKAQKEIRQYFSPKILYLIDTGITKF